MLQEISERLLTGGAISHLDDIYWLTKTELEMLITQLDKNMPLSDLSEAIPDRQAEHDTFRGYVPPSMLPEKSKKPYHMQLKYRKMGKLY